jgi:hypothetical protein
LVGEVRDGVGRFGWAKVAGAVGSSTVVVANVRGQHGTQVPPAERGTLTDALGLVQADRRFGERVVPRRPLRLIASLRSEL